MREELFAGGNKCLHPIGCSRTAKYGDLENGVAVFCKRHRCVALALAFSRLAHGASLPYCAEILLAFLNIVKIHGCKISVDLKISAVIDM
jgi:hypothetical protein